MPDTAIGSSMFETVRHQGEQIDVHAIKIAALEKTDQRHDERLRKLEENAVKLENTVMRENSETRSTMREQTAKLFTIVENAMGYQSARTAQTHELRMAKLNTWSTVFLKVSGGVVGLLSVVRLIMYFNTI